MQYVIAGEASGLAWMHAGIYFGRTFP